MKVMKTISLSIEAAEKISKFENQSATINDLILEHCE